MLDKSFGLVGIFEEGGDGIDALGLGIDMSKSRNMLINGVGFDEEVLAGWITVVFDHVAVPVFHENAERCPERGIRINSSYREEFGLVDVVDTVVGSSGEEGLVGETLLEFGEHVCELFWDNSVFSIDRSVVEAAITNGGDFAHLLF